MSASLLDLLRHIEQECQFLIEDSDAIDEDHFMRDERRKRAYARSFEVIGEASKQIAPSVRARFDEIEWTAMARMRDRLIHHYFGVDYSLVWDAVMNDIPRLLTEIKNALETLREEEKS